VSLARIPVGAKGVLCYFKIPENDQFFANSYLIQIKSEKCE
jgi:hypothetical protein